MAALVMVALIAASLGAQGQPRTNDRLRLGISVLLDDQVSLVRGRRILLVTEENARDERGRSVRELLTSDRRATAARLTVVAIVTASDIGETRLAASIDSVTSQISTVVIDLVDLGTRYGAAPRSLLVALRGAARRGVPVIVLDRPNPLTGEHAEGPAADSVSAASDGVYGLPARHGMTLGEMAKWFNEASAIKAQLTVVPVRGWRRSNWPADRDIDLPRVGGQPVTADQLLLHGAFAPLAATNVRFALGPGRATVRFGAPWLDARRVATSLADRLIPGVEFTSGRDELPDAAGDWKPMPTVRVTVTSRVQASSPRVFAAVVATIRSTHGDSLRLNLETFARLTGSRTFGQALFIGDDSDAIVDRDLANVIAFRRRIRSFLQY